MENRGRIRQKLKKLNGSFNGHTHFWSYLIEHRQTPILSNLFQTQWSKVTTSVKKFQVNKVVNLLLFYISVNFNGALEPIKKGYEHMVKLTC